MNVTFTGFHVDTDNGLFLALGQNTEIFIYHHAFSHPKNLDVWQELVGTGLSTFVHLGSYRVVVSRRHTAREDLRQTS